MEWMTLDNLEFEDVMESLLGAAAFALLLAAGKWMWKGRPAILGLFSYSLPVLLVTLVDIAVNVSGIWPRSSWFYPVPLSWTTITVMGVVILYQSYFLWKIETARTRREPQRPHYYRSYKADFLRDGFWTWDSWAFNHDADRWEPYNLKDSCPSRKCRRLWRRLRRRPLTLREEPGDLDIVSRSPHRLLHVECHRCGYKKRTIIGMEGSVQEAWMKRVIADICSKAENREYLKKDLHDRLPQDMLAHDHK